MRHGRWTSCRTSSRAGTGPGSLRWSHPSTPLRTCFTPVSPAFEVAGRSLDGVLLRSWTGLKLVAVCPRQFVSTAARSSPRRCSISGPVNRYPKPELDSGGTEFHNARRSHSSRGRTTPDQFLRQTAVRTLSGLIHDTRFHLQNRGALFRRTRPPHSLKGMEGNLRDACFKFVTLRETTTRVQKWSSQYIFSWLPRQDSNLRPAD